jgi:predicted transcriptional regulator
MKTIKQIAEEIGVSRQAVYDKIKKEPLSSALKEFALKHDNTLHYTLDGANLIKSAFDKDEQSSVSSKALDNISQVLIETLQHQVTFLTSQNEDLRQQLNEERTHSRQQSDKIIELTAEMTKLANNAQQLHAMENIKPQLSDGKKQGIISRIFSRG